MTAPWPHAWGAPAGSAVIRSCPEDFQVREELGFELSGDGEHAFLYVQKRELNTPDLVQRISRLSGVAPRDIGISGLKDRNALTCQWLSVGLAGKAEPDWSALESDGDVRVLEVSRHQRKLRRGVHRGNRFTLVLRELQGERDALEQRLEKLGAAGVPNYFGEQRFGRGGSTLRQARQWMEQNGPRVSRNKRGLYLSALRAQLFNQLLSQRVSCATWNVVLDGDVCMLQGTRSHFTCEQVDEQIAARAAAGDLHPALPLWGRGESAAGVQRARQQAECLAEQVAECEFLQQAGLDMAWRAARVLADDFCWCFCDDGSLQLDFALGAGSYATALLGELVQYKEKRDTGSDKGSEQG
jgi:tRNA pseudouridine13 synthase